MNKDFTIMKKKIPVLLSIGSNLGEKKDNIKGAFKLLKELSILKNAKISSFYLTEPVEFKEQPWFVNVAVSGNTDLELNSLVEMCKSIEYSIGRKKREKWHEREIDIDIIFYGNLLLETEQLTIPHKRMHKRKFVLQPASEIAGNFIHPKLGLSVSNLLDNCTDKAIVKIV